MPRRLVSLACLLAGALSAAPAAAAPVLGVYAEDGFAAGSYTGNQAAWLQRRAGLGAVRFQVSWREIEPSRGSRDWDRIDRAVAAAARHGLTVLPFLFDAPPWASGVPAAVPGIFPPRDPADFAAFAAAAVRRYGPGGTLWRADPSLPELPVRTWQVWNEPNLANFWRPLPDPAGYAALLRAAYPAIKGVDPAAAVLLAGMPDSEVGVPLRDYLSGVYAAGGRGFFDALSVHAYAPDPLGVLTVVDTARRTAAAHGDGALGTWVSEFGYASAGDESFITTTEPGQAVLAAGAALALRRVATAWNLRGIFYFNWRDPVRPAWARDIWPYHTGLLRSDGTAKPALGALAAAFGAPLGEAALAPATTAPRRLRLRARLLGRRQLRLRCARRCTVSVSLLAMLPREGRGPLRHTAGRWQRELRGGRRLTLRLRPPAAERAWLAAHPGASLRASVTALGADGAIASAERRLPR